MEKYKTIDLSNIVGIVGSIYVLSAISGFNLLAECPHLGICYEGSSKPAVTI